VVWGDVGFDLYPDGVRRLGGCALNVALAAVNAGACAVSVLGALGDDGQPLRARLDAAGVNTGPLRHMPGASSLQPILLGPGGERVLRGYEAGVLADLPLDAALRSTLRSAGLVYVPTFAQTADWARLALSLSPCALDLMDLEEDLGPGDLVGEALEQADLVFCGLSPDHPRLSELRDRARNLVVVTLGAAGSLAITPGGEVHQPAAEVSGGVVDTTGCGDAFAGGFLADWRGGASLESCMARGAEEAARVAGHLGSVRGS
jgi:ribokinase